MARTAYAYALDLLAVRGYTTNNLRRKMEQKGYPAEELELTVDRLLESGLLDDRKFAAEYARQKLVVSGSSVRRVKQELARKGIDAGTINESVQLVEEEETVDVDAMIEKMAVKKLRSMGGLAEEVQRRRVFGFLARKGYELDAIKRVIARLFLK